MTAITGPANDHVGSTGTTTEIDTTQLTYGVEQVTALLASPAASRTRACAKGRSPLPGSACAGSRSAPSTGRRVVALHRSS